MKIYFMAISILLRPSGVFYVHLKYSVVIWYFPPLWYVVGTKENLAALLACYSGDVVYIVGHFVL
jgi:hypothetical protein